VTASRDPALEAWRINARVSAFLVENLPDAIWASGLPRSPRRTIRSIAAHLHNCRLMWMRSLGAGPGVRVPAAVDPRTAARHDVVTALDASGRAILSMLEAGQENGGEFPGVSSTFVWGAIPRQVALFVGYALSHEAHHRGQLLVMSRELGHRLPAKVVGGLWQWSSRLKESRPKRAAGT